MASPSLLVMPSGLSVGQLQRWSSRPRVWSSQQTCLGVSPQYYYSTQEAEKEPEEEPLHNIISDTEAVQGTGTAADIFPMKACSQILNVALPLIFQVVSTNMSFRLKPKSCWILSPGPCTQRKRWCKVGQKLLSLQFTFTALLWLTCLSFRSLSGSSSLTAATHWKNCATNWYQQVVKRLQWRSTCRVMQQRAPSPFRYTCLLTLEVLDKF